MYQLPLIPSLKRRREKATIFYRKTLKRVFNKSFILLFVLAFALIGCSLKITDAETPKIDVQPIDATYKVSFYNANLDFNGSINVQANNSINIAQLKTDLDLNATALFLTSDTTDRIDETSYQVTQNVNFYAIPEVYEIQTEVELAAIDANDTTLTGKYILLNDIELTSATLDDSAGWNPIGDDPKPFTGIFNGNGYKITNLWIDRPSTDAVGLFGNIHKNAQIRNLGVEINNSKGGVKGKYKVGGIAGSIQSYSSITNSYSTGNVSATGGLVGGIAGYASGS
ncbi:MAG: hypothetical protein LBP89_03750, partial [Helicobacteraceae bacterium]|nr:hypothetical protein [Helicobacteraceae bacterium]